jgi:ParB family chromosome partitioning protein
VRHVEQRLRLAALAPGILDALRVGKISLDAAKAYAGIADQKVQLQVFEAEESKEQHRLGWGHSPIAIRDAINGRVYTPEHKAVRFVGLDAYIAAGGRVERDLFFGAEDRELLLDPAIVDRLAEEKAEAEAARLAQAAGFGQGATKSWLAPRHAEPKAPAGFQAVYREPPADVRAEAVQAFEIAEDGSGLKPIDRWFVKAEGKPAATYGREAEEQAAARAHRRLVEIRAARLAVPPIAGSPLEGMAYWPPNDGYVPTFEPAADCDGVVVAMLIKVPADQVAAMRERAEWALAEEEAAAAAAARTAPAEDASEAGTSDDEVPAETPAELEEPVS